MVLRFVCFFMIAALAAIPARADTAADSSGAAPVPQAQKSDLPEEPIVDTGMQMPEAPQQHPGEKPAPVMKEEKPVAMDEEYGAPNLIVSVAPAAHVEKDKTATFTLTLRQKDDKPVTEDMLEERHTRKIHLLAVDQSLTDYQHLHPETLKDGWRFSFTPKTAHNYKIWVDVKLKSEPPQMALMGFEGAEPCKEPCVDKAAVTSAEFNGNKAELSFDDGLKAGSPARATVSLTTADGSPLKNLEPVMGAFAHIAAFPENLSGVVHVHPLGVQPKNDDDRGVAPINFMLHPEKPGLLKIFVQIKVDGKDMFLPFAVTVKDADSKPAPDKEAPAPAPEPAPEPAH